MTALGIAQISSLDDPPSMIIDRVRGSDFALAHLYSEKTDVWIRKPLYDIATSVYLMLDEDGLGAEFELWVEGWKVLEPWLLISRGASIWGERAPMKSDDLVQVRMALQGEARFVEVTA
jgi:hypothetical protein